MLSSFQEINVMVVSTDKIILLLLVMIAAVMSWCSHAHVQMDSAKLHYVQYNTDNLNPEGFQLSGLTESSICHVT